MRIETLCTGDELLQGQTLDTNFYWLGEQLSGLGYAIARHQTVGDEKKETASVINEISTRADLCVCSGGLGPTEDDLTAEVVAQVLGVSLVRDQKSEHTILQKFYERDIKCNPTNLKSADLPEGATIFQNPVGIAPAFMVKIGRCDFYFLPGVPKEFQSLSEDWFFGELKKKFPMPPFADQILKVMGWRESVLAERLTPILASVPDLKIGYKAAHPEVWIKLRLPRERERELLKLADRIAKTVGVGVFSRGADELVHVIDRALKTKKKTLALAESCTGGLLASLITRIPGCSEYFLGAWMTYANSFKEKQLLVDSRLLQEKGAVSAEVATEMAVQALNHSGADLSLSITGVAGPAGGTLLKPVGTVFIGMAIRQGHSQPKVQVIKKRFFGDRQMIRRSSAYYALEILRREVMGFEPLTSDP